MPARSKRALSKVGNVHRAKKKAKQPQSPTSSSVDVEDRADEQLMTMFDLGEDGVVKAVTTDEVNVIGKQVDLRWDCWKEYEGTDKLSGPRQDPAWGRVVARRDPRPCPVSARRRSNRPRRCHHGARCPMCRLLAMLRLTTQTLRSSVSGPAHKIRHRSQVSTGELPTHRVVPLCAGSRL